jgi:hypothetical protein
VADWVTISQVATAGGTLVLAVATFSSIRSSNHSARVAERALLVAQRPILIPSNVTDPDENVRFGDGYVIQVPGHGGHVQIAEDRLYMAMTLRNGGSGLAVIHGWQVEATESGLTTDITRPRLDGFRRQSRDLYIPANQPGFWQAAIRDREDPAYPAIREATETGQRINVYLMYGDHEGGQRTIVRFGIGPVDGIDGDAGRSRAEVVRYWNVDGSDPR